MNNSFYNFQEESVPLTVPIPDETPGEGASLPQTGDSYYSDDGTHPDLGEVPMPEEPRNN